MRDPTPLPILPLLNPPLQSKHTSLLGGIRLRRQTGRALPFVISCGIFVYLLISSQGSGVRIYLSQRVTLWNQKYAQDLHIAASTVTEPLNATTSETEDLFGDVVPLRPGLTGKRPLTALGFRADESYKLGSSTPLAYRYELSSFIRTAFPPDLQPLLQSRFDLHFPLAKDGNPGPVRGSLPAMISFKNIWQTNKIHGADMGGWKYRNLQWDWSMLNDVDAAMWVQAKFRGSRIETVWDELPTNILKADFLRYLLVFYYGGVYSDTDTSCLHAIEEWGASADLWDDGKGWLAPAEGEETLESRKKAMGPPSVVIGIEVDVGDREDWHRWWPRPLQIVQWTFGAAPRHPILLDVISRVVSSTAHAKAWSDDRDKRVAALQEAGRIEEANAFASVPLFDNDNNGGYMSVMEWTGPGIFTDAVFRYLDARYNVTWPALKGLERPLRVGDVMILPMTGFSPGINGAKGPDDPQAMVQHMFLGTWKGSG
ncbi:membrane-bound alpha-1,6- mannosyltransferase Initiation-specific [Tulasnella sp. 331]|nr:membrane-bound alpha-1,6- mannosyltransferase Initiation-specific [Tulasnella sp. 331]